MLAEHVVHQRKAQFSWHPILSYILLDEEIEVGASFVRLLLKVAYGAWIFVSLALEKLTKDAEDGIPKLTYCCAVFYILQAYSSNIDSGAK